MTLWNPIIGQLKFREIIMLHTKYKHGEICLIFQLKKVTWHQVLVDMTHKQSLINSSGLMAYQNIDIDCTTGLNSLIHLWMIVYLQSMSTWMYTDTYLYIYIYRNCFKSKKKLAIEQFSDDQFCPDITYQCIELNCTRFGVIWKSTLFKW